MRIALGLLFLCGATVGFAHLVRENEKTPVDNQTSRRDVLVSNSEPTVTIETDNVLGKEPERERKSDVLDEFKDKGNNGHHKDRTGDPPPPVPEPTSVLTFGSALIAIGLYIRYRRRARAAMTQS